MSKPNTRAIIDANIRQNGQQLITGQVLNATLNAMVTDYAEQAALDGLKEKVDALALGAFYGYFPDSDSLPADVTTPGYAYVGLDNPYEIWNFNGESWSDSGTSIDMNDADEEDITRNADGKLQFKDRSYGDGMGYVILRKDKTFAEQVTQANTIYEIRYDFVLQEEEVIIPANCILKFNGGSIGGSSILFGNATRIEAEKVLLFGDGLIIKGDWIVSAVYSEWVGLSEDSFDNSRVLSNLLALDNADVFTDIYIQDGEFSTNVLDSDYGYLIPSNTHIHNAATIKVNATSRGKYALFCIKNADNVTFEGGALVGDVRTHTGSTGEQGHGLYFISSSNCNCKNVIAKEFWGDGFSVQSPQDGMPNTNLLISNVKSFYNRRQGISVEGVDGLIIEDSEFSYTGGIHATAPTAGIDIEPWNSTQVCKNILVRNCRFMNNGGSGIRVDYNQHTSASVDDIVFKDCISFDNANDYIAKVADINFDGCLLGNMDTYDGTLQINTSVLSAKINNCTIYGMINSQGGQLVLSNSRVIKKNVPSSVWGYGAVNCLGKNNIIENNYIEDSATEVYGLYLNNGGDDAQESLIKNNIIKVSNATKYGMRIENATGVFSGNICRFNKWFIQRQQGHILYLNNIFESIEGNTSAFVTEAAHDTNFVYDSEFLGCNFIGFTTIYTNYSGGAKTRIELPVYVDGGSSIVDYADKGRLLLATYSNKIGFAGASSMKRYDGEESNIRTSGTFANKPSPTNAGFQYFNTDTHKPMIWDGSKWYYADGTEATS